MQRKCSNSLSKIQLHHHQQQHKTYPRGKVRRAKLHYLRDRVGKEAVTVKTIR